MTPDHSSSSHGEPLASGSKPASAGPQETDEDLFDFDELRSASTRQQTASRDLEDVLAAVETAKVEVARDVAPLAAKNRPPASAATPVAKSLAPAAPIKHVEPSKTIAPTAVAAPTTIVHQKLSMSPLAAVLLGAIVLANVALMLVAWNSVQSVKRLVLDVTHDVADSTSELRAESTRRSQLAALESEPVFGALPEGYRTLEIATERMKRGEHARARRMLYGLLSVVDRVEQPARSEVEAQAGFLIGDSFRLEADALRKGRTP